MNAPRPVIFDDECGFCKRWIAFFQRFDWLQSFEWVARTDPRTAVRFPQVSGERAKGEMVSVRPDGHVNGGFFAVRDILIRLPLTFVPALFMYVPGASLIGTPVYRWIARNRHRFGGKAACSVKK